MASGLPEERPRLLIGVDGRPANAARRVGAGNVCYEILRAIVPLADDVSFRVYLDREPRDDFPVESGAVDIRVLPQGRLWTQRALAAELRRDPPNVFLAFNMGIPLGVKCPRVAFFLDLAFYTFPEYFTWRFRAASKLYARLSARYSERFLAISEATKQDMTARLGIESERISVALLGVSPRFRRATPSGALDELRQRRQLPERYVLYVGTLQPRKNIGRLIEAFTQLCERRPDLPHDLVIAGGKGWLYDSIFQSVEASPVKDRVHFLGFVPDEDLPALVKGADLLALVSLWEGFGLPVIEAMACGTAVITSDSSSLAEVAGDAAILIDPYDTAAISAGLERALGDDAFREDLVERGHVQAQRYTWEDAARVTLDVLRTVAAEHSGGGADA